MMTDEIYALAAFLSPDPEPNETVLRALCRAAEKEIAFKLKSNFTPELCKDSFVMAAALVAVSHYEDALRAANGSVKAFSVGDFSVSADDGGRAGKALRAQAELLMMPFSKNGFSFMGVS